MSDLARRIIDHYEHHALAWDLDRGSNAWNDACWHERFRKALPEQATVLDLGCGSGRPVASHFASAGFRLTGIDAAPTMIALCRRRLPAHEWIVADMRTLALGRRFQGILAFDSYFHLHYDDQRRMFDVFAAHASPRALLMFNTGPGHGEAIGSYRGDPLYHASLAASEYESLIAAAGFDLVAHATNDAEAGGRTVWLARSRMAA